jgi:hypothetical protein
LRLNKPSHQLARFKGRRSSGGLLIFGNLIAPFLVHCTRQIAAQSDWHWYLVYLDYPGSQRSAPPRFRKGTKMSKTASVTLAPSTGIFTRLMASIDRLLMASARIAIRNGDLPYFGL